jgi:GntR family transcriptional regulator, transcriptional repressor for pyruvate dehydrogenase complex
VREPRDSVGARGMDTTQATGNVASPAMGWSLPQQVFNGLFEQIISGDVQPGDVLPSERRLTEQFGVNRQVVREAIKRLDHLGLVHSDQGAGTRVLNWRHTGNFELVGLLALRSTSGRDELDQHLARSLLEVRRTFGVDTARLCALRADAALTDELAEMVEAMPAAGSPIERAAANWAFWDRLLDGADNLCYRLMLNSIRTALPKAVVLMSHYSEGLPADIDQYRDLVAAIASGDQDAAGLAAERLLAVKPTDLAHDAGLFAAPEPAALAPQT